jgi:Flp pilus assembly protein TadD
MALTKRAEEDMRAGDLSGAAATLERALRIEPNNAGLWSRLAEVRLRQGDKAQAEQLALKSSGLAAGNAALKARNDQIIAQARAR